MRLIAILIPFHKLQGGIMGKIVQDHLHLNSQRQTQDYSISEIYNENSKLHPSTIHAVLPATEYSKEELQAMIKGYKQYPHAKKIKLLTPKQDRKTFWEVIESRRSIKTFGDEALNFEQLSIILWQSYGTTGEIDEPGVGKRLKRVVPSAGGLYPGEIYLGVRNVSGLDPGVYHYNVPNHELELLSSGDPTQSLHKICCQQDFAQEAGVVIMMSAVLERTKRKYGERGYRYVLLDLGHLGQNIYLSCTAQQLAVVTTCGFYDDLGNDFLKLDGLNESLMYIAFIGKNKEL